MSLYRALGRAPALALGLAGAGSPAGALADLLRRRDALRVQDELGRLDAIGAGAAEDLLGVEGEVAELAAELQDSSRLLSAWAVFQTDGAGGVTLLDGEGVTGASVVAPRVRLTLERAMADYFVAGSRVNGSGGVHGLNQMANQLDVVLWYTVGVINLSLSAATVGVAVVGRAA